MDNPPQPPILMWHSLMLVVACQGNKWRSTIASNPRLSASNNNKLVAENFLIYPNGMTSNLPQETEPNVYYRALHLAVAAYLDTPLRGKQVWTVLCASRFGLV